MKIGIISDIHEDYIRLKECLLRMEKLQCDELVCLGDITGFDVMHYKYISSRHAVNCLALVRENCRYVIPGNHDLFNAGITPHGQGLFDFPERWYDKDFCERYSLGHEKVWLYEDHDLPSRIGKKEKDYIRQLPENVQFNAGSRKLLFSHSVHPDLSGSAVWRPREANHFQKHFDYMKNMGCHVGISGHFHPAGIETATSDRYRFLSFGCHPITDEPVQFMVPCIATGSGYNGYSILDLKSMTLEAIPLRSPKYRFERFV